MEQHKWHKEIKAWADGAEIEWRWLPSIDGTTDNWRLYQQGNSLTFFQEGVQYRIKTQPKEPQYLYVYKGGIGHEPIFCFARSGDRLVEQNYIGKIKLEVDD